MKLYRGTGCHVVLVGALTEVPLLEMDEKNDFLVTIKIAVNTSNQDISNLYNVVVSGDSALRIKQYGFLGLHLWIEGELHTQKNNTKIMAEKIIFLDNSEPNPSDIQNCLIANSLSVSLKQRTLLDQGYLVH